MVDNEAAQNDLLDLIVIGGGINGTGIARDAAGRGLRVALCEMGDLAQFTSSASTKLIHGGLRYLESYDFKLVRHALQEREVLLRSAPHIIWPLRFILPHHASLRPRWLIRLGLFLYDHLGGRELLPSSTGVDLRRHPSGAPLKKSFTHGFEYSDGWVQDARLVVLNARDAQRRGARILTRTKCVDLQREQDLWRATLQNTGNGKRTEIAARAVVNATGPWVAETIGLNPAAAASAGVRLVKGSHIVVKKLFAHPHPYIFQNADGRVVFAVPYEDDYTLLGTTDVEITGDDPAKAEISQTETRYICDAVSEYFEQTVRPDDVIWSYTGVRPLYDDQSQDASKVTRDYVLKLDTEGPALMSVFGGKITTFRKLSEQAVDLLKAPLGFDAPAWTSSASLPGGDIPRADFAAFAEQCRTRYAWLGEHLLTDYAKNYGTEIDSLLEDRNGLPDLGIDFGGGLYEAEVRHLVNNEWAETADDILWRRTKKGLRLSAEQVSYLVDWLREFRADLPVN